MIAGVPRFEATRLASLPAELHHRGPPTAWTQMTRPGQSLHSFLEGLVFDASGALLVADVPYGRILRLMDGEDRWNTLFSYDGEPHGLAIESSGTLLIADYRRGLLRLDAARGTIETVVPGHAGEPFRGLSDLAIDGEGAIWFTDSGRTSLTDPRGRLFRLAGDRLDCVLDCIPYPNGIGFSPDGGSVFVAATRSNAVWRLARSWVGTGQPMAGIYAQFSGGLGPDGLAVSPDGHLAVAQAQAGRVWLLSAIGDPLACIATPGGLWTTSVRFGGPGGRTLYIVEAQSGSIFTWSLGQLERS